MAGSAWRRLWSVFGLLVVCIVAVMLWRMAMAPMPMAPASASRAQMVAAPISTAAMTGGAHEARPDNAMIVPAGFMRAPSGGLLPRFATLATAPVTVRLGPGDGYPEAWSLRSADMPVEVLAEAGNWVRIRDHEGEEGWVRARLLDGVRRMALVAPWRHGARVGLRAAPEEGAPLKAWLGSGLAVQVLSCDGLWCRVQAGSVTGWLRQPQLWGVYHDERIGEAKG